MSALPDRLFALIDLLRGQPRLTSLALAEHFGVSERTIRRDLGRLQALEVEVEVRPGRGGGVILGRGALLPALRFTDDEALVIGLGLKQAQRADDFRLAQAAESAMRRLEQVLTERLGERVRALLGATATDPSSGLVAGPLSSTTLLDLAESVERRRRLEVRYRSRKNAFTYRQFDPYGIVHTNEHWYTVGFCHLRQAVRVFRADRLEVLRATDQGFELPKGFDALTKVEQSLARAPFPGSLTCRVWVQASLPELSRQLPAYVAVLEPQDGGALLTVQAGADWLGQVVLYLLALPFSLRVLEPPELREAFETLGRRARALGSGKLA